MIDDSSFFTYIGAISLKRMRRFDRLTTDLGHALVVCDLTQISHSFQRNRSKVSEKTTINLIIGAMNNIFHNDRCFIYS